MPATHRPRADQPGDRQDEARQSGTLVRATAIHPPPGIVAGRATVEVDAPRKPISSVYVGGPAVVDGLQHGVRVGAIGVGPLDRLRSRRFRRRPGRGMRSEASKPMPVAPFAISDSDLQLVVARVPLGRGGGVGRDGAAGARSSFWMPSGVARNCATARTSGRSTSTMSVSAEPSASFWAGSMVGNGNIPMSSPMMYLDGSRVGPLIREEVRPVPGRDLLHPALRARQIVGEHRIHRRLLVGGHDRRVAAEDVAWA